MSDIDKDKEFENAIVEYGGIITKICYYFSSNTDEYKDLRQEVFYNLWKGWESFKKNSKLSTWIYRVSFNTCVSFNRKEKKSNQTISIDEVLDFATEPESSLLDKYNTMHALIQKLSFQDRAIILMWLDEKTYEEISEMMGIPRNTIAVKLKRIKEKLIKMSEFNG